MQLWQLDLNLLRVFDALFEERSTTRAGDRLGLSQSAISHALGRLRAVLKDELFLRAPDGMRPTPLALEIGPRLRTALVALGRALEPDGFQPATSHRRFVVAGNPYCLQVLLPHVASLVLREAPAAELVLRPAMLGVGEQLADGRVDLAVGGFRRVPARLDAEVVLRDRLVWAMRSGHPAAREPLTTERLGRLAQVRRAQVETQADATGGIITERGLERRVTQDDGGALQRALAPLGLHPAMPAVVPDTQTALAVVRHSDLVALVPHRLAAAGPPGLHLADPPYPAEPVEFVAVWTRTRADEPALRWLRDVVRRAARELPAD